MKAIILAAGKTLTAKDGKPWYSNLYFPENSKPKCLFHYGGETVLERQVRVLRKCGLNDIRIVVGYQKELIKRFIQQKNWNLEVVENPRAIYDKLDPHKDWIEFFESVRVGVEGINDDVLVILGDVLITEEAVKTLLRVENPNAIIMCHLFKVSKDKVSLLRHFKCIGVLNIYEFFRDNKGVIIVSKLEYDGGGWHEMPEPLIINWKTHFTDLDWYTQTDEYEKRVI